MTCRSQNLHRVSAGAFATLAAELPAVRANPVGGTLGGLHRAKMEKDV
jgi:hypothetical protein